MMWQLQLVLYGANIFSSLAQALCVFAQWLATPDGVNIAMACILRLCIDRSASATGALRNPMCSSGSFDHLGLEAGRGQMTLPTVSGENWNRHRTDQIPT